MSSLGLSQLLLAMTLPLLELESTFVPTAQTVSTGVRALGRQVVRDHKVWDKRIGRRRDPQEVSLPAQCEGTLPWLFLSPQDVLWHLLLFGYRLF